MIRLWLLQAAALMLLLHISSVKGLLDFNGCDKRKACWVSEECIDGFDKEKPKEAGAETFTIREKQDDYDKVKSCSKYFVVEPGLDFFDFEFMHSGIDKNKEAIINFNNGLSGSTFTCLKQQVTSGPAGKSIDVVPQRAEHPHLYCRFKVKEKTKSPSRTFWQSFESKYKAINVFIHTDVRTIKIENYNKNYFEGRVPCDQSILVPEEFEGNEHHIKPLHDVMSRMYTCPPGYIMSHKLFKDAQYTRADDDFTLTTRDVECNLGQVTMEVNFKVAKVKCYRHRNSMCANLTCTDCKAPKRITNKIENGKRMIQCNSKFMILNGNFIANKNTASCSEKSKPTFHRWNVLGEKNPIDREITSVLCVDELDCNDIAPFGHAECSGCEAAVSSEGGLTCPGGGKLMFFDELNQNHSAIVTCDKMKGEWSLEYDGTTHSLRKNESASIRLGCVGGKPEIIETKKPAAAQAGNTLLVVGCSMAVLILLLLLLLLIYCLCCRQRAEKPKEQPKMTPTLTPPPSKTDSSAVEVELPAPVSEPAPPPPPPVEPEPAPMIFSGKRVELINVSKERLREIEPDAGTLPEEFSARDKTDSERSKTTQVSQVGQVTTDGAPTFTGPRATEQTNEVSRTMAANDLSRSDLSRGTNSSMNDRSQTGAGGGKTPTIGEAAGKKMKGEKGEKGGGPRVEFRERVSYETDTKTRDKSSIGSMVTAPEQLTQHTQPEGNTVEGQKKDEPSRLAADKASKAFGKEKTRTTQNTNETNAERSKMTDDVSRTG